MDNKIQDKWELALEVEIKLLQQCQESKNLKSCTICSELLECPIRQKYIKAVYESMSKGSGGGFEF